MADTIESPCISVCQLDDEEAYCIGCFRTPEEIEHWPEFSNEEKKRILTELEQRRKEQEQP